MSTNKRIDEHIFMHRDSETLFDNKKERTLCRHAKPWMNLKIIMRSERNQTTGKGTVRDSIYIVSYLKANKTNP